jgi:acetylornithine deacetylase/succinyl-diaminopimelate desuccinylase-like protein
MEVRERSAAGAVGSARPLRGRPHGLDADRIHAPNEYVDLSRLPRGAEFAAYLGTELAGAAQA